MQSKWLYWLHRFPIIPTVSIDWEAVLLSF